jgi:hypothetical protein
MKLFKILETSFERYDLSVKNYLTKVLSSIGEKYSNSQIYQIIFNAIKGIMQNAMFYIEDSLSEQNVETAYRKSSLYSLAKVSGFEPYYGSAATGILNCTVQVSKGIQDATKIYISNGTKLVNNTTGYNYICYLPSDYYIIDLSRPLLSNQIKIIQGSWRNAHYISKGEPLETVHVTTLGMYDKEYIEVTVDGKKYDIQSCLYDMSENGEECIVSAGYDNTLDIIFGNGIHGKQLKSGQTISVKYIVHNGALGNISLSDEYNFTFTSQLMNDKNEVVKDNSVLNLNLSTSISGGSNPDTTDDIRHMIGYNSRSLVLANENNYKLFFKRFSFIGYNNVWSESNSLIVNAVCLTNYKDIIKEYNDYFNINVNSLLLSEYQKEMILNSLNSSNKTYAGVSLNFIDPIIYKYAIICYVKVNSTYNKDVTKELINKTIAEYFMNLPVNTNFVSKSDLIKYILDNIEYVTAIDLTFISDMYERAYYNNYYYTYKKINVDGEYKYEYTKNVFDKSNTLGLDDLGNIKLNSLFEIPIISNNVTYIPNKDEHSKSNKIILDNAVQIYFY